MIPVEVFEEQNSPESEHDTSAEIETIEMSQEIQEINIKMFIMYTEPYFLQTQLKNLIFASIIIRKINHNRPVNRVCQLLLHFAPAA